MMRKSYWQLVLLGSILVVGIATTEEAPPKRRPPPPPRAPPPPPPLPPNLLYPAYEFLVLAQTWPPTLCRNRTGSNCPTPVPNRFTIHGLWPTNRTLLLTNCCATEPTHPDCPFDSGKASNNSAQTLRALYSDWPNLYNRESNFNFLRHEWTKHGTCSLRNLTQTSYFANALRLFRAYNLGTAITTSPDFRNRTISIANLKTAVRARTNSTVTVVCNSVNQVLEVRVCANVDASALIDCTQRDACSTATNVTLPLP